MSLKVACIYIYIKQSLISLLYTFAKLKNIFAKLILLLDSELVLKDIKEIVFAYFINNNFKTILNNKQIFIFLYKYYFLKLV